LNGFCATISPPEDPEYSSRWSGKRFFDLSSGVFNV
jgi:hypothetical protein